MSIEKKLIYEKFDFGDAEMEKGKFHYSKGLRFINNVCIDKILICKKGFFFW